MVADALIYHPTVAHYLRFVATNAGRDKVLRSIQFFARFYAWYLYRTNNPQRVIVPWDAIKKQFGLIRKGMRLGKFVEHFKAASVAADAKGGDEVGAPCSVYGPRSSLQKGQDSEDKVFTTPILLLRWCTVGRQLGYATYMVLDNITFLDVAGIRPLASVKDLQKRANEAWMIGLICSLVAGVYQVYNLRTLSRNVNRKEGEGVLEEKRLEKERNATQLQLISDVGDMTVALSILGHADLDDGIVGLAGLTSSLIGLRSAWQKTA